MNDIKLDRYRLITGTNTQTRNLYLALNILKILGQSSLPLSFLKEKALKWDEKEKINSTWYREHNGELTNLSFNYYIDLLKEIGFLSQIGEVVRSSRNGQLYLFLNENQEVSKRLKDWEKVFIFYFLLQKDSDFIICLLDLIVDHKEGIIEKDIRQKFNNHLVRRLEVKRDLVPTKAKNEINQKMRELARLDSGKKHVNKHSIPVRLEWLIDIGILKQNNNRHTLSSKGKDFYASLISFEKNGDTYSDITNDWFNNHFFISMSLITNINLATTEEYLPDLKKYLFSFFNKFSSDGAYRLNVETTLLYLTLSLIQNKNVYVELGSIDKLFQKGIGTNELFFTKKEGSRKNESYISIKFL